MKSTFLSSGCDGDVLAGEAAADEIDWLEVVLADTFDVKESWDIRPSLFEDFIAEGIDLDLPRRLEPSPFQTKVDTADTREQAAVGQRTLHAT